MNTLTPNPVFGCVLASWSAGLYVHPDITLQGLNASTYETIPADEYEVHPASGMVIRKPFDDDASPNAVDWSIYSAYRASYYLYNPSTNSATAHPTLEAQTMTELDLGIKASLPVTGRLNESTAAKGTFLAGDYLSLGTVGSRPVDANTGTGIWGDKLGIVGLNASTQQAVFSAVDGKIKAGAGVVTLDADGISISAGNGEVNYIKWLDSTDLIMGQYAHVTGGVTDAHLYAKGKNSSNRESILTLAARTDDGAPHAGTGSVSIVLDTELDSGSAVITAPAIGLAGTVTATNLIASNSFTSVGIDDNANAIAITIDSSENVGIGTTTPSGRFNVAYSLTNVGTFVSTITSGSGGGASVQLVSDDGAAVVSGDRLGQLAFQGADNASHTFGTGAAIRGIATETFSATGHGGQLGFYTVPNASTTLTLAVTIQQNQAVLFAGEIEIDGALNHDGSTVGFYGVTPVSRPAAYTQTYSTTTRTNSSSIPGALTDSTGGGSTDIISDVGSIYDRDTINDNFASIVTIVNALITAVTNAKQLNNSIIDDLQSLGLAQ